MQTQLIRDANNQSLGSASRTRALIPEGIYCGPTLHPGADSPEPAVRHSKVAGRSMRSGGDRREHANTHLRQLDRKLDSFVNLPRT